MLHALIAKLLASNNQFFSGGLMLMATGSIGYALRKFPHMLKDFFYRQFTVVLDVQSSDNAYEWLLAWLGKQEYSQRTRRVSIKHIKNARGDRHAVMIPAKGNHWFFYHGKPIWISRNKDSDAHASGDAGIAAAFAAKEYISIRTVGRSRAVLDDIIASAKQEFESMDKHLALIWRFKYGDWLLSRKPKRPLESIYLPPEAEGLVEDIQKFIQAKDWHYKLGIPYKRGYLFYGPPGTGKSSTVEALAGYFDMPIYILNLASVGNDALEEAIASLKNDGPCILLLEDVDTAHPSRDNGNNTNTKLALGTLLNALDGVQTVDNVVLVMTTNNPSALDPALIRHGRVDRQVEFGFATDGQIAQAVTRFVGDATVEQQQDIAAWPRPISMAEVQERLKQFVLNDAR